MIILRFMSRAISAALDLSPELYALLLELESCILELLVPRP